MTTTPLLASDDFQCSVPGCGTEHHVYHLAARSFSKRDPLVLTHVDDMIAQRLIAGGDDTIVHEVWTLPADVIDIASHLHLLQVPGAQADRWSVELTATLVAKALGSIQDNAHHHSLYEHLVTLGYVEPPVVRATPVSRPTQYTRSTGVTQLDTAADQDDQPTYLPIRYTPPSERVGAVEARVVLADGRIAHAGDLMTFPVKDEVTDAMTPAMTHVLVPMMPGSQALTSACGAYVLSDDTLASKKAVVDCPQCLAKQA